MLSMVSAKAGRTRPQSWANLTSDLKRHFEAETDDSSVSLERGLFHAKKVLFVLENRGLLLKPALLLKFQSKRAVNMC